MNNTEKMPTLWGSIVDSSDAVTDVISDAQAPGIFGFILAGIPLMFILIRWGLKYQREFTNLYIEENQKLRERLVHLEAERLKDKSTIVEMQLEVGNLKNQVEDHERTIEHLNKIIERRKLQEP